MEPPSPPGLLILAGQSKEEQLSSVETFGFENCTIPSLPESRYGFGTFLTPTDSPQLAVCGGWWAGKPSSSDCLTLNVVSGQWERGMFTNGLLEDGVQGVINLDGEGIFVVHSIGISVLATGSQSWVGGPIFLAPAVCGCNISSSSFVTIHMNATNNVRQYSVSNNIATPEEINSWPDLRTPRWGPACGATFSHLVVAGGVSNWDEVLATVEVFDLSRKSIRRGGSLKRPRAYFQMIPVGVKHPRLLAIGGKDSSSTLSSSEWWDEEEDRWEDGPSLTSGRASPSSVMISPHLVCLETNPLAHSCPLLGDTEQTCTLKPGRKS